ncbi:MAG: phosphoribosylanthranilate isomerase, partial [Myxococcota bacterium]
GGTGRAAPPELARRVALERRTILAGGLNPETVTDAIAAVEPWGVDTASGVESSPGVKDPERVHRFVAAARAAFARES